MDDRGASKRRLNNPQTWYTVRRERHAIGFGQVTTSFRFPLLLLSAGLLCVVIAAFVFLQNVGRFSPKDPDLDSYGAATFDYRIVSYRALDGWAEDNHDEALHAFLRSCAAMTPLTNDVPANRREALGPNVGDISVAGTIADWRAPCIEAARLAARTNDAPDAQRAAARMFFETNFQPLQILDVRAPGATHPRPTAPPLVRESGLFTGYFEPVYEASATPTEIFSAPVLARPADLIEVDLGAFREELAGKRIAGRVSGGSLRPYADHRAINSGALSGETAPLAYMDPNDLFFLQIQGSGQLTIGDERLRIGYAGQNGHPYTAIGKVMRERDIMPLSEISMQTIRTWLENASPRAAREMREENASYVFFIELNIDDGPGAGPLGAQGVSLTDKRSLAVDRRYHPMGAPVWIDLDPIDGASEGERFRRLMIAQDTGGAIRGPVRGDVFWGAGARAGEIAGTMRANGRMFVLAPRAVVRRLEALRDNDRGGP